MRSVWGLYVELGDVRWPETCRGDRAFGRVVSLWHNRFHYTSFHVKSQFLRPYRCREDLPCSYTDHLRKQNVALTVASVHCVRAPQQDGE